MNKGLSVDLKLRQLFEKSLSYVDESETRGPRLCDDAERLWNRVQKFLALNLLLVEVDPGPLEMACYALQLPMRQLKLLPTGRLGRTNLRDRAEQAAEMIVTLLGGRIDESLIDRTTQLLHEIPQRAPVLDEARLLADAVNLDDFGVIGLFLQTIHASRTGAGILQIAEGSEKREQYGYWDARLRDGFHFEPIRKIAIQRLDKSRKVAALLLDELKEDRPL